MKLVYNIQQKSCKTSFINVKVALTKWVESLSKSRADIIVRITQIMKPALETKVKLNTFQQKFSSIYMDIYKMKFRNNNNNNNNNNMKQNQMVNDIRNDAYGGQ